MDDFLVRLEIEQKELQEKTEKLYGFISGKGIDSVTSVQKVLLNAQLNSMRCYNDILVARIVDLTN